jgi:hypothetical protein
MQSSSLELVRREYGAPPKLRTVKYKMHREREAEKRGDR